MLSSQLKSFKAALNQSFANKPHILPATRKLVQFVDDIIGNLFNKHQLHHKNQFCLLAVGSYGRRELQLHSDIDLILLHNNQLSTAWEEAAQQFIQECWDAGLDISHQVTTVDQLATLAESDLSVISSIMDMRVVAGLNTLQEELAYRTHPAHMWPSHAFFLAKRQEQKARYAKYGETAYNLEPNVKNGPGGLRDLQVLLSVGKRHFGIKKLSDGITCGFFNEKEYEQLLNCLHFLWKVRFAMHAITDKQEERLLFDHQLKLAQFFNYVDGPHNLAIERFMKDYFQVIKRSRELNGLLLQWFAEAIIEQPRQVIVPVNEHFQLANQYLEVKHPQVFRYQPSTLLELFNIISQNPKIKGIRADTIRLLRDNLYLLNKSFRQQPESQRLFMNIFRNETPPYPTLHAMNQHGILGRYLKAFGQISGQMQYDLFHAFTVDQHTLFVIRNLGRFLDLNYQQNFPLAYLIMPKLQHREVLYLAALFHDIAKGRGGDHSELGAREAEQFSKNHGLTEANTRLLVWLVKEHLLMSHTAQRLDIYDPQVIKDFCLKLPDPLWLDYLYLLTVADICATNPNLWTIWKDSLLKELYRAAKEAMQPSQLPVNEEDMISIRQFEAMKILSQEGWNNHPVQKLWHSVKGKYFLHESPEIIARHTKAILTCQQFPLIIILPHFSQGGTEVFIYSPHREDRFAIATTVLSNHHTTIQEATIISCDNGYNLDIYIILDENNKAILKQELIIAIENDLRYYFSPNTAAPVVVKRRISRAKAHFNIKTSVQISYDAHMKLHKLFIIASDRPGLLSQISRLLVDHGVVLHHAKIATAGERAEDTFMVSAKDNTALSDKAIAQLKQAIINSGAKYNPKSGC